MKKFLFLWLSLTAAVGLLAQKTQKDTVAVMILQHMSDVIGDLNSVSFELNTSVDEENYEYGIETHFGHSQVLMLGPDKMLVHSNGPKGHRGFWYNGVTFTYYSFDENNYAIVDAPPTIIETIDTIHKTYGIRFPAADFFYPTFTEDLLEYFDNLIYLGLVMLNGEEYFHVLTSSAKINAQFWIANDAFNLPKKFILTYKDKGNLQYEATFSNWQLNPEIPVSVFEFLPPPKAAQISIMAN